MGLAGQTIYRRTRPVPVPYRVQVPSSHGPSRTARALKRMGLDKDFTS